MNRLVTAFVAVVVAASPASAQTDSDKKLINAAEQGAFMMACPKHGERLPPRTQRLLMGILEDAIRDHGKEAMRQATLDAYANGYDKQGERWCASMEKILTDAGRF